MKKSSCCNSSYTLWIDEGGQAAYPVCDKCGKGCNIKKGVKMTNNQDTSFHRANNKDSICVYCKTKIGMAMKCPGCGHIDPPVTTQDTSVEWDKQLEEYLMMYHDAEEGLIVFKEDYNEFFQGLHSLLSRAEQRGYLAGSKEEREKVLEMCEEMKIEIPSQVSNPDYGKTYNQALSDLQSRINRLT